MTDVIRINDVSAIRSFLRKDPARNIYLLGDLDPFFFSKTEWHAAYGDGGILEIAMFYRGGVANTLLGFADRDVRLLAEVIDKAAGNLPDKFYAHLSCGLVQHLKNVSVAAHLGKHLKMTLTDKSKLDSADHRNIIRMYPDDEGKLNSLYNEDYPENYFDRRMLETGKYFGYYHSGKLAGAAGIHVYSPAERVAALGNVVIKKEARGGGICRKLISVLCRDLLESADVIGLNVHSENLPAIRCYESCGFIVSGEYEEFSICRN